MNKRQQKSILVHKKCEKLSFWKRTTIPTSCLVKWMINCTWKGSNFWVCSSRPYVLATIKGVLSKDYLLQKPIKIFFQQSWKNPKPFASILLNFKFSNIKVQKNKYEVFSFADKTLVARKCSVARAILTWHFAPCPSINICRINIWLYITNKKLSSSRARALDVNRILSLDFLFKSLLISWQM